VTYDPKADLYVRLGVSPTATAAEIRTAYRARIKHAHPDMPTGSTAKAAALNVAYGVLGDAAKRAAYDEARRVHVAKAAAARAAAAAKAAAAKAAARAKPRAKRARARAAAPAVSKATRKVRGAVRAAAPPSSPPAPPPRSAADVAIDNVIHNIRNKQYGRAAGWFVLGVFTSAPPAQPSPPARPSSGQRRRR
jgi:curved DNA-binding protein CbpA